MLKRILADCFHMFLDYLCFTKKLRQIRTFCNVIKIKLIEFEKIFLDATKSINKMQHELNSQEEKNHIGEKKIFNEKNIFHFLCAKRFCFPVRRFTDMQISKKEHLLNSQVYFYLLIYFLL